MSGNCGDDPVPLPSVDGTVHADQAAYDRLHPALRAFLAAAPVPYDSQAVLQAQATLGVRDALRVGLQNQRGAFPDFEPILTRPRRMQR